jgi:hypothetical protein
MDQINYSVVHDEVINNTSLLVVTRLLALDLKNNPYKTIGDFISKMNEFDLQVLVDKINEASETKEPDSDILLMSIMLAIAEGVDFNLDIEGVTKCHNYLTNFIVIESLGRKGLVKVHHKNMSFGDDCDDKIIVEKIA